MNDSEFSIANPPTPVPLNGTNVGFPNDPLTPMHVKNLIGKAIQQNPNWNNQSFRLLIDKIIELARLKDVCFCMGHTRATSESFEHKKTDGSFHMTRKSSKWLVFFSFLQRVGDVWVIPPTNHLVNKNTLQEGHPPPLVTFDKTEIIPFDNKELRKNVKKDGIDFLAVVTNLLQLMAAKPLNSSKPRRQLANFGSPISNMSTCFIGFFNERVYPKTIFGVHASMIHETNPEIDDTLVGSMDVLYAPKISRKRSRNDQQESTETRYFTESFLEQARGAMEIIESDLMACYKKASDAKQFRTLFVGMYHTSMDLISTLTDSTRLEEFHAEYQTMLHPSDIGFYMVVEGARRFQRNVIDMNIKELTEEAVDNSLLNSWSDAVYYLMREAELDYGVESEDCKRIYRMQHNLINIQLKAFYFIAKAAAEKFVIPDDTTASNALAAFIGRFESTAFSAESAVMKTQTLDFLRNMATKIGSRGGTVKIEETGYNICCHPIVGIAKTMFDNLGDDIEKEISTAIAVIVLKSLELHQAPIVGGIQDFVVYPEALEYYGINRAQLSFFNNVVHTIKTLTNILLTEDRSIKYIMAYAFVHPEIIMSMSFLQAEYIMLQKGIPLNVFLKTDLNPNGIVYSLIYAVIFYFHRHLDTLRFFDSAVDVINSSILVIKDKLKKQAEMIPANVLWGFTEPHGDDQVDVMNTPVTSIVKKGNVFITKHANSIKLQTARKVTFLFSDWAVPFTTLEDGKFHKWDITDIQWNIPAAVNVRCMQIRNKLLELENDDELEAIKERFEKLLPVGINTEIIRKFFAVEAAIVSFRFLDHADKHLIARMHPEAVQEFVISNETIRFAKHTINAQYERDKETELPQMKFRNEYKFILMCLCIFVPEVIYKGMNFKSIPLFTINSTNDKFVVNEDVQLGDFNIFSE